MSLRLHPLRATLYLASYLVVGPVLFAVALAVLASSFALSIVVFGVPLLAGAAIVVRGCAGVERARARLFGERVIGTYATLPDEGLLARLRARWTDRATRRDVVYLIPLLLILLPLDAVALGLWVTVLAGVLLPAWYWAVPNGDYGPGLLLGHGSGAASFIVDDLGSALVAAVVFLLLAPFAALLLNTAARVHAAAVRYFLGAYVDPLAEAKAILRGPGPLPSA
ncbi:sensor domain-containing protein [Dactylosporangium vinaceum]|uniref:Sensor domain-containing protein n=1 Tax=Dactylosporangium vinaceum TaxID=53362 RepID=A0ABV5ML69_9ACTN|nr:sensor domain-containing protein [Dactylosporangium vinaceum]UAB94070.1 sensor domain-containing protein [Dactylosporangium vinaceum]